MSMTNNERAWRHEREFVPATIEQVLELQQRLVDEAGATPAKATGAVMWLLRKAHGTDDAAATQRSAYRKLFAKLDAPTPRRPRGRGRAVGAGVVELSPAELLRIAYEDHGTVVAIGVPTLRGTPIISDHARAAA